MNRVRKIKVEEFKQSGLSPKEAYDKAAKWWKSLSRKEQRGVNNELK